MTTMMTMIKTLIPLKRKRRFKSFDDARTFARSLGLTNVEHWRGYVKSGKKPDDIPSS